MDLGGATSIVQQKWRDAREMAKNTLGGRLPRRVGVLDLVAPPWPSRLAEGGVPMANSRVWVACRCIQGPASVQDMIDELFSRHNKRIAIGAFHKWVRDYGTDDDDSQSWEGIRKAFISSKFDPMPSVTSCVRGVL